MKKQAEAFVNIGSRTGRLAIFLQIYFIRGFSGLTSAYEMLFKCKFFILVRNIKLILINGIYGINNSDINGYK